MKLRTFVLFTLLAVANPSWSWEPNHPTTTIVDELLATNIYGSLSIRDTYVDGDLLAREWKFTSYRDHVVTITLTRSGDQIDVRTPAEWILVKRLSSRKFEIVNMDSGARKTFWMNPTEPDAITVNDSDSPWFQDFFAFKDYADSRSRSYTQASLVNPLLKGASVQQCLFDRPNCGPQHLVLFIIGTVAAVEVCAASFGTACLQAAVGWGWGADYIVSNCGCVPYQEPPPSTPTYPAPGGDETSCGASLCRNHPGNISSGTYQCAWGWDYIGGNGELIAQTCEEWVPLFP